MTFRQLLDRLLDAWRASDAQRAAMCFREDATYREARHGAVVGRAAIAEHFARFFRDGPAWQIEVDDLIIEGERAALAYRFSIKGEGGGWRERAGCAVVHRKNGLITLWREYEG